MCLVCKDGCPLCFFFSSCLQSSVMRLKVLLLKVAMLIFSLCNQGLVDIYLGGQARITLHATHDFSLLWSPPCGHRYETTSSDDSSSEDSSSSGSEEEEDDEEKECGDEEECEKVEGQSPGEGVQQEGAEDVDKKEEEEGEECPEKQEMRERWVKEIQDSGLFLILVRF